MQVLNMDNISYDAHIFDKSINHYGSYLAAMS